MLTIFRLGNLMKKIIYTILLLFGILAIGFAEPSDQIKHFIDNRVPDIHYKLLVF